jgi:hypothetical protein
MPSMPVRIRSICSRPLSSRLGRSICVLSPVMTRARVQPQPREEHLHLCVGRVLRLVEDDERVGECAPAHVRERGDLDHARLECPRDALRRHQIVEGIVQRTEVRVDLGLHVAGEEAERLAGLDRRTCEDDPFHALARERVDRSRDGQIGLPRARRPRCR